ncbi:MAG: T9SS type A sorting domain-containing protein [Chitinophagales bacterium]|nr:T9SS type A sorting domain-containing protein [Chitinophagales bacterium]
MKNFTLFALILLCTVSAQAQATCEDPLLVFEDDIENYAVGEVTLQSPYWDVWPGGATGGIVSQEQALSGTNSIKIDGSIGTQDVLLLTGDQTSGHYILSWSMYIPDGNQGYFNLQHEAPTSSAGFWAFEVFFEADGAGRLTLYDGSDEVSFSYPYDSWFNVYLFIDQDNDEARLNINERFVDGWQFSTGNTTGNQINSINFYPDNDGVVFYIDDVKMEEIPAAEEGLYCHTAVALDEPGFYEMPGLSCWGGSLDQGGNGSGFQGYWYTYTPDSDGILYIASCGGGVDTRGWILSGDCHDLKIVGVNDDQCDIGSGSAWASYREAVVTAGTQYLIAWDDAWESDGFTFELGFSTAEPEEGAFCQSAQDITPGDYDIIELTGDAAVAGPDINNTSGSTTSYAQSQWYQYTPTLDGYMSISSCELGASDTHFFVYTGDCSHLYGLNLIAQNDNGCGEGNLTSSLDSIEVSAGTTYYIEWIDRWADDAFQWTLGFESFEASSMATFHVDMSMETVDPQGVFIAGSFSNFNNLPMSDEDGDGIWSTSLLLQNNTTYTYKFKNGPDGWENIDTSIGDDCTMGGYGDRFVEMGAEDVELNPVCFGYCVSCAMVDTEEAIANGNWSVYPNPVEGSNTVNISFAFEHKIESLSVILIDALGRTLFVEKLDDIQEGTTTMSTNTLPSGMYQIQLIADGQLLARPLIIQ